MNNTEDDETKSPFVIEVNTSPHPEDPQEKRYFRKAFEQITHDIQFFNVDKEYVYSILWDNRLGGLDLVSRELKASDMSMNWLWFDKWLARFQEISLYPYMWNRWLAKGRLYPTDIDSATQKLTVKNMKNILERLGYKEYPKLRAKLEIFFKKHVNYDDLQPELKERMIEKGWKENDEYHELKIELLCHSVILRAYAIRDFERHTPEYLRSMSNRFITKPQISFVGDDDEEKIVREFIKQPIKNGKVVLLTPFFPGGRASIRYFYRKPLSS
ncbi:hypothetical protein [Rodentibacter pneumotropicus]|uniref:hypothetical protein n=1 Tax=Rodentibacter pneumotropicus TaxID=758 RepID=UPI001EE1DB73|nr:hypothetical protein [Rodentibacter pneumotropicus]